MGVVVTLPRLPTNANTIWLSVHQSVWPVLRDLDIECICTRICVLGDFGDFDHGWAPGWGSTSGISVVLE